MPTTIYALRDYEPPAPPEPAPDLTPVQVDKVKARIRLLLTPGYPKADPENEEDEFVSGPMEDWRLLHHATHEARRVDGITTVTPAQVQQVLAEMAQGDEFKEGMGKAKAVAEPLPK